ncbi:MAG TPA: hypothetical protein VGI97_14650 [Gemmatimonadaceae bacterium]|jgi:hypothetical protein
MDDNSSEYAIQHRTSKRFLLLPPRLQVHRETAIEKAAHRWKTMTEAQLEVFEHMGSFGSAFDVVPVSKVARA